MERIVFKIKNCLNCPFGKSNNNWSLITCSISKSENNIPMTILENCPLSNEEYLITLDQDDFLIKKT